MLKLLTNVVSDADWNEGKSSNDPVGVCNSTHDEVYAIVFLGKPSLPSIKLIDDDLTSNAKLLSDGVG